ncbi:MAG: glutathione synthase [Gammaproteobacteria bacterium]
MTKKLGVLMDPIATIHYKKDSTLAMLWEAEKRGWDIFYFEQSDLFLRDNSVFANACSLKTFHDPMHWFELSDKQILPLNELDVVLMRKDPPFNLEYIYTTYLLEHAERQGVLVVNKPQSLRDANEKLFTTWFPECCPPTLITRDKNLLRDFFKAQKDIVCKPLDGMGGASVFRLTYPDENASVVFETLTQNGTSMMAAQRYIPEIKQGGDKRILVIDGKPIPYALARIPIEGELRGNLAAGGRGVAQVLTERDQWICEQVGETLRAKGLLFVGLDVIGDYLTEINVTSPTCIRELDDQTGSTISSQLFDCIELKLNSA